MNKKNAVTWGCPYGGAYAIYYICGMDKFLTATEVASRREWLDDEIEHLEIESDLIRSKEDVAAGRLVPNEAVMKMLEAKCR